MRLVSEHPFSLQPIFKWNGMFSGKSRVLINGQRTRYKVDGQILYQCIQVYSYYLLFITDDEAMIYVTNIYLFHNRKQIDNAKIYASYLEDDLNVFFGLIDEDTYSGELTNFRCLFSNIMTFQLFHRIWKLEVLQKSRSYLCSDMDDRSCGRLLVRPSGFKTYLKFMIIRPQSINLDLYNEWL